jgi:hypothetical protein
MPTIVDLGILAGTICFFLFLFLIFLRLVPFVPLAEVKELRHELGGSDGSAGRGWAPDGGGAGREVAPLKEK